MISVTNLARVGVDGMNTGVDDVGIDDMNNDAEAGTKEDGCRGGYETDPSRVGDDSLVQEL